LQLLYFFILKIENTKMKNDDFYRKIYHFLSICSRDFTFFFFWKHVFVAAVIPECTSFENEKMKIDELDFERMKQKTIKQYLIADNLKGMYIAYVTHKQEEKNKRRRRSKPVPPEQREVRYYAWGEKKETKGVVPQRIEMRLEFWNAKMNDAHVFEAMFPILGYPSKPIEEEKKNKEDAYSGQHDQVEQADDQQAGPEGAIA